MININDLKYRYFSKSDELYAGYYLIIQDDPYVASHIAQEVGIDYNIFCQLCEKYEHIKQYNKYNRLSYCFINKQDIVELVDTIKTMNLLRGDVA
jgi:hypothetical protein